MDLIRNIFNTEGRLNRLHYIKYMVILAITAGLSTFVMSSMATFLTGDPNGFLVNLITGIWALIAGVGNAMLMIRRLHDLGKSGYFVLIALIPVIGFVFSIYLFFAPGQYGANEYGDDPLES